MTVETMKTIDLLADRENEKLHREVIIYDFGSPVLKVETGTTLKVLKLLYGTDHERKRQILGVRPKNIGEGGIPCIVTLDESKLCEISYDILVSEDSANKKEVEVEGSNTTNRCIDCSRESWKTKRFTSVGMNTELSLNPGVEVDMSKLNKTSSQQSPNSSQVTANHDKGGTFPSKNGSVTQHSPSAANTRGAVSYLQQKELHAKPPSRTNGNHHEEVERPHERPGVTSPTYGVEMYSNHRSSQIRYPSLEPPAHYERFVQPHGWMIERGGRYDPTRPHHDPTNPSLASRRSPGHRSRSPISPRAGEYLPHSHYHAFHEKYRPVLLPTNYMHGSRRRDVRHPPAEDKSEPTYIKKENSKEQIQPLHASETNDKVGRTNLQPGDEPPVFVLPNDYDVVSGIDPRIASMQEKRSGKFSPLSPSQDKDDEKPAKAISENGDKEMKDEFQNSPTESASSYSPKGTNGVANVSPDSPPTNSSQKLYCKICSGVFPTKSLLYKHLRGHTSDEKPFKCNECGQGFTLSSNLRQHRIIHRGYKPFQCEFCGKKFMRSNVYKQHRRIHTGEEMHKCGLCPSEFLQKYALLKHMKKNHDIDAVDA